MGPRWASCYLGNRGNGERLLENKERNHWGAQEDLDQYKVRFGLMD